MTIIEMLQDVNISARVSVPPRWLVGDTAGNYIVYERKPYMKKTRTVIFTANEEEAVRFLVNDDSEVQ
jgi:hypothetical protein